MKKWYVAVLLGTSLGTLAADAASMKDGSSTKSAQAPALKNELSLYEVFDNHNVNLGIRADLLYMVYNAPVLAYAVDRGTDAALWNRSTQTNNTQYSSKVQNVRGRMSVGCNLALTYTMHDRPGYSFESSWFHIVAQFKNSFSSNTVLPAYAASLTKTAPGTASVTGHQNINLFDLVAKKSFGFGDWVGITPLAGLVGGYMNGKSTSHYQATSGSFQDTASLSAVTNSYLHYHTKFEGIGVKLGLNSSFKIWHSFSFKADLSYGVMYGLSRATEAFSQNALDANSVYGTHSAYSNHHARSFVDALLGLAWASHFDHNRCYFDIHAGWRYQSFFTGWTTFGNSNPTNIYEINYAGQGLQVGATFKF